LYVIVPETEVVGKQRPHPAVCGVTTQKFEFLQERVTKITPSKSTDITLITAADFGNKQVVLNHLNSSISGEILVLQHMYLARKENAKILIKIF
jgi:hypothetical protein